MTQRIVVRLQYHTNTVNHSNFLTSSSWSPQQIQLNIHGKVFDGGCGPEKRGEDAARAEGHRQAQGKVDSSWERTWA